MEKPKYKGTGIYAGGPTRPTRPGEESKDMVPVVDYGSGPEFFKNCAWWCLVGVSVFLSIYYLISG